MLDITETLERLQNDRQFLATVVLTMFFLAIFPIYFSSAGGAGDSSMNVVADYKVEGELEYIELDNATEYIFDGETLELTFTTDVIEDASSKNIVGVEVSMSYGEDEQANGPSCAGPLQGQSAADTITAIATHDSNNGSGLGQNNGGSGDHSVEVTWYNTSILGANISGLSKAEIIDELDSKGAGEGEYLIQISVDAENGNAPGPLCTRSDDGEEVSYSVKLIVLDLDNVTISTELEIETGEEA
jgi:hypothetical protein